MDNNSDVPDSAASFVVTASVIRSSVYANGNAVYEPGKVALSISSISSTTLGGPCDEILPEESVNEAVDTETLGFLHVSPSTVDHAPMVVRHRGRAWGHTLTL